MSYCSANLKITTVKFSSKVQFMSFQNATSGINNQFHSNSCSSFMFKFLFVHLKDIIKVNISKGKCQKSFASCVRLRLTSHRYSEVCRWNKKVARSLELHCTM